MKRVCCIALVLVAFFSPSLVIAQCLCVPGDVNGTGACNGLDVVFLVWYLKGAGPPPPCVLCFGIPGLACGADANGNCAVNGIDVTYLVSFLKGVGPGPVVCPAC
jgi:hypothetical protein